MLNAGATQCSARFRRVKRECDVGASRAARERHTNLTLLPPRYRKDVA